MLRARRVHLLIGTALFFWSVYLGASISGVVHPWSHEPIDQHTRQAAAWLSGEISLNQAPAHLEIAEYKGRFFNSFPPTPTFLELPLVLCFGRNTPNTLMMWFFSLFVFLVVIRSLERWGFLQRSPYLLRAGFSLEATYTPLY